jgi:hypothetical protein
MRVAIGHQTGPTQSGTHVTHPALLPEPMCGLSALTTLFLGPIPATHIQTQRSASCATHLTRTYTGSARLPEPSPKSQLALEEISPRATSSSGTGIHVGAGSLGAGTGRSWRHHLTKPHGPPSSMLRSGVPGSRKPPRCMRGSLPRVLTNHPLVRSSLATNIQRRVRARRRTGEGEHSTRVQQTNGKQQGWNTEVQVKPQHVRGCACVAGGTCARGSPHSPRTTNWAKHAHNRRLDNEPLTLDPSPHPPFPFHPGQS